jgi:hypothetical protein
LSVRPVRAWIELPPSSRDCSGTEGAQPTPPRPDRVGCSHPIRLGARRPARLRTALRPRRRTPPLLWSMRHAAREDSSRQRLSRRAPLLGRSGRRLMVEPLRDSSDDHVTDRANAPCQRPLTDDRGRGPTLPERSAPLLTTSGLAPSTRGRCNASVVWIRLTELVLVSRPLRRGASQARSCG